MDLSKYFIIHFRTGYGPQETRGFFFLGTPISLSDGKKREPTLGELRGQAIRRAQEHCKKMNLRYLTCKPLVEDLDLLENPPKISQDNSVLKETLNSIAFSASNPGLTT